MNGHVEGRVGVGYCTSPSLELNVLKLTAYANLTRPHHTTYNKTSTAANFEPGRGSVSRGGLR